MNDSARPDRADLETSIDFVNTFGLTRGRNFDDFGTTREAIDWLHERTGLNSARSSSIRRPCWTGSPAPGRRSGSSGTRAPKAGQRPISAVAEVNRVLRHQSVLELEPSEDVSGHQLRLASRFTGRRGRLRPGRASGAAGSRGRQPRCRAGPDLRGRRLPMGLLRQLADAPAALVRHGELRQPGQGGPPSGQGSGRRARLGDSRRTTPSGGSRLPDDEVDQPAAGMDHPVRRSAGEELRDPRPGQDQPLELGLVDPHGDGDPIADLAVHLDRDLARLGGVASSSTAGHDSRVDRATGGRPSRPGGGSIARR